MKAIFECKLTVEGNKASAKFSMTEAEDMDPKQTAQILNEIDRLDKRIERILANNASVTMNINNGEDAGQQLNSEAPAESITDETVSE